MTVRYSAPWVDPEWLRSCEGQDPANLLKHEVVNKTDWAKIIKLMQ
jgi:hypothetical protein